MCPIEYYLGFFFLFEVCVALSFYTYQTILQEKPYPKTT